MYTVDCKFTVAAEILKAHGLERGGKVQSFFTSEVMRLSDKYIPKDSAGVLSASAKMSDDKDAIIYNTPYARYHWYGKLMVDPKTGKGAFFSPTYGFWSRPKVQKVLTDRDLNYQGAPIRGPRWVERAYIDNREQIIQAVEKCARGE